jgi:hypothetical protein
MNEEGQRVIFDVPEVLSDTPQRFIDVTKLKNPIELFL